MRPTGNRLSALLPARHYRFTQRISELGFEIFRNNCLLLVRPWKLTNEFLAGHRVRYVHPLRLYLLASILFFFAASYGIKSAHLQPLDLSPSTRAEIRSQLEQEKVPTEVRDKIEQAIGGK